MAARFAWLAAVVRRRGERRRVRRNGRIERKFLREAYGGREEVNSQIRGCGIGGC